jgi:SPP1 family predicted phage head-tail adaptor
MYRPKAAEQMTTVVKLQNRVTTNVSGAKNISYVDAADPILFCNFKTYGGNESEINGKLVIDNTATVVTWYRPDIKASGRIILLSDDSLWDIISDPENIEQRNQFVSFKVRKVTGGA